MIVGMAVLTTVASSALRLIPSMRPVVIARRRQRLIPGRCVAPIRSAYHRGLDEPAVPEGIPRFFREHFSR